MKVPLVFLLLCMIIEVIIHFFTGHLIFHSNTSRFAIRGYKVEKKNTNLLFQQTCQHTPCTVKDICMFIFIYLFIYYQRDIPWEPTLDIVKHLAFGCRRGPAPQGTHAGFIMLHSASIPHSHSIQDQAYSLRVDFI